MQYINESEIAEDLEAYQAGGDEIVAVVTMLIIYKARYMNIAKYECQ